MDNMIITVPAMLMGYFTLNLQNYKCITTCDAIWCIFIGPKIRGTLQYASMPVSGKSGLRQYSRHWRSIDFQDR